MYFYKSFECLLTNYALSLTLKKSSNQAQGNVK